MRKRINIRLHGLVQGVGFRPYVHRLASELGLDGWVLNDPRGVELEAEGEEPALRALLLRLPAELPPLARIHGMESVWLDAAGLAGFEIRGSGRGGEATALVLPDVATCPDCLAEILDPTDRHHHYPFTNCTHCGPRFSVIKALPYDRANTTLAGFALCPDCQREYGDPADRRFHAQPTACPACGPRLALWDAGGRETASGHQALLEAARLLRRGDAVAVKGVGGFHLMADAANENAIGLLRVAKRREEKPLALLFPDLDSVRGQCLVSAEEARLLASPEAPIVLLLRHASCPGRLPDSLAPGTPYLGAMLPSNPLHHLLARAFGGPLVATSGNRSDEPICTDEREALDRLFGMALHFLVHDRPIARHVDDSIVRVLMGRDMVLRRARGYAPLPLELPFDAPGEALGFGPHLKATVGLRRGRQVFLSQHLGDLDTPQALEAHARVRADLCALLAAKPGRAAHDLHPDYASTREAAASGLPRVAVQHHHAHIAACMAENRLQGEALGLAWDGAGFGPDNTVWGGEFLACTYAGFRRLGRLRPFRLPGGDAAARDPRRALLGCLHALWGADTLAKAKGLAALDSFNAAEAGLLLQALERGLNAPVTTSAGRLFDAAAALAGFARPMRHEGQAAMGLEAAAGDWLQGDPYPWAIMEGDALALDWGPGLLAMAEDARAGAPAQTLAARFHLMLVEGSLDLLVRLRAATGLDRVCLSGGCFQNRLLLERMVERLAEQGFKPYWHQRVPPNDGGIALGQLAVEGFRAAAEARP